MSKLVERLDGFLAANHWRSETTFIDGNQEGDDLTFGDMRAIRHGLTALDLLLSFDATGDDDFLQEAIRDARAMERQLS